MGDKTYSPVAIQRRLRGVTGRIKSSTDHGNLALFDARSAASSSRSLWLDAIEEMEETAQLILILRCSKLRPLTDEQVAALKQP
jgi:hypothetical protein